MDRGQVESVLLCSGEAGTITGLRCETAVLTLLGEIPFMVVLQHTRSKHDIGTDCSTLPLGHSSVGHEAAASLRHRYSFCYDEVDVLCRARTISRYLFQG